MVVCTQSLEIVVYTVQNELADPCCHIFNIFGCVLKGFKLVSVLTSLKLTRPDRCRLVFPSPVRFFPKKEISEDRTGPGLVQKRLKNWTGPDLETLFGNIVWISTIGSFKVLVENLVSMAVRGEIFQKFRCLCVENLSEICFIMHHAPPNID